MHGYSDTLCRSLPTSNLSPDGHIRFLQCTRPRLSPLHSSLGRVSRPVTRDDTSSLTLTVRTAAASASLGRSSLAGLKRQTAGFDPSDVPTQCQNDCATILNSLSVSPCGRGQITNTNPSYCRAVRTSAACARTPSTKASTAVSNASSPSRATKTSSHKPRAVCRVRALWHYACLPVSSSHHGSCRVPAGVPAGGREHHPRACHPALRLVSHCWWLQYGRLQPYRHLAFGPARDRWRGVEEWCCVCLGVGCVNSRLRGSRVRSSGAVETQTRHAMCTRLLEGG